MTTAATAVLMAAAAAAAAAVTTADASRVLAVQTVAARSQWNFMSAVLRALTDAGHRVTVFTPFPEGGRENYAEVDTSAYMPVRTDRGLAEMVANYSRPATTVGLITGVYRSFCDAVYRHPELREIVRRGRDDGRFDVVVMEPVGVDCTSALAAALGLPLIHTVPSPMLSFAEREITGHWSNPACVAHLLAPRAVPRTFAHRAANAALLAYSVLRTRYDAWALRVADPQPYDRPPATVRPAVVFRNGHHVVEAPSPVPPNVVGVGGVHLSRPARAVPTEILDFIEDSPHGVIYFTFGSIIKLSSLPEHVEKIFKEVLATVPQRVLWKYETEMKDMPKNVMIKKWFPQREILLHPNVKLFISHGGISGVYEAVDAGIPVLGFPLLYDQPRNIDRLVHEEMAISLDLSSLSKDKLLNAITELINNEKYLRNAKTLSNLFKDQPMSPAESVVYWTEYVVRHKGAPNFNPHVFNLTWYQYFMLDVIFVMAIFIFIVSFMTCKVLKMIVKYLHNYHVKID